MHELTLRYGSEQCAFDPPYRPLANRRAAYTSKIEQCGIENDKVRAIKERNRCIGDCKPATSRFRLI